MRINSHYYQSLINHHKSMIKFEHNGHKSNFFELTKLFRFAKKSF
jgi:hypothetical protein